MESAVELVEELVVGSAVEPPAEPLVEPVVESTGKEDDICDDWEELSRAPADDCTDCAVVVER